MSNNFGYQPLRMQLLYTKIKPFSEPSRGQQLTTTANQKAVPPRLLMYGLVGSVSWQFSSVSVGVGRGVGLVSSISAFENALLSSPICRSPTLPLPTQAGLCPEAVSSVLVKKIEGCTGMIPLSS